MQLNFSGKALFELSELAEKNKNYALLTQIHKEIERRYPGLHQALFFDEMTPIGCSECPLRLHQSFRVMSTSLEESFGRLAEQIARGGLYGFAPSPEQLEQRRQDERWASDPLGIQEWAESELGFILRDVANGLGDISEGIDAIARWLRDLSDDLI